jgi:high-affinity Fe2+/Pb2+ permease
MASILGVLTSFQENVEHAMRVGALAAGMIVSILTAVSIVRGWKKKRK